MDTKVVLNIKTMNHECVTSYLYFVVLNCFVLLLAVRDE
jgi:hypothetical protein